MLGPVEVRDGAGCLVEVSGARLRALLALLALRPGQVAAAGYLIDELWEAHPPDGAANALQALVSRLRRALPAGVVGSRPGGYQLAVDRDQVDVFRFERLAGRGGRCWRRAIRPRRRRRCGRRWRSGGASAGRRGRVRAGAGRGRPAGSSCGWPYRGPHRGGPPARVVGGRAPALVAELEGLLAGASAARDAFRAADARAGRRGPPRRGARGVRADARAAGRRARGGPVG